MDAIQQGVKKKMKKLAGVLSLAMLTACATRGTNFEMADVNSFQPGVTTIQEATAKLGKPHAVKYDKNGRQLVTWTYAHASLAGSGGKAARIVFDADGKMERIFAKVE